ncbi:MAG: hypothetical protein COB50_03665 [Thiotrichales bacterium]|nr:MAG: hypothetical protein COB50_03665 [Thiotrichales bacterium]
MDYIKTIDEFPLLSVFESRWEAFQRDFTVLKRHFKLGSHTSNKSIVGQVRGFSYFLHGKTIPEMIALGFRHPDWSDEQLPQIQQSFEATLAMPEIAESMDFLRGIQDELGLISVYFSSMKPSARFTVHFNDDPYMYRGHLGLTIPSGDIGLQVCDTVVKWQQGKVFVFDTLNAHRAWNLSEEERTVLIIDFYRPEADRAAMQALEAEQLTERLAQDKASFGFSGGSKQEQVTDEIKRRYGTEPTRIFRWDEAA